MQTGLSPYAEVVEELRAVLHQIAVHDSSEPARAYAELCLENLKFSWLRMVLECARGGPYYDRLVRANALLQVMHGA